RDGRRPPGRARLGHRRPRPGGGPVRTGAADRPARILAVWCPDWPDDGAEEGSAAARVFERVVTAVEAFCPVVEVIRPGWCVLGARGPARYFGGEEALARQIAAAVTARGYACHTGVADGQFAACLAARAAGGARATGVTGAVDAAVVVPPGGT